MNITEVRIFILRQNEGFVKARATITIDNAFAVHDIKVVEGQDGNLKIRMPSRKTPDGEYVDIAHPINQETRILLSDIILKEYEAKKQAEGAAAE